MTSSGSSWRSGASRQVGLRVGGTEGGIISKGENENRSGFQIDAEIPVFRLADLQEREKGYLSD